MESATQLRVDVRNCARSFTANPQQLRPDVACSIQVAKGETVIRTAKLLFCDNEHGMGEITYPDFRGDDEVLRQHFVNSPTAAQLRKDAKKEGWSRHAGADYCPMCTEGGI
jgi:hypothetical protein